MNEDYLRRKLYSVGHGKFVEYFDVFKNYSKGRINKITAIDKLVKGGAGNSNGSAIRCGNAKIIFDNGWEDRALEIATGK